MDDEVWGGVLECEGWGAWVRGGGAWVRVVIMTACVTTTCPRSQLGTVMGLLIGWEKNTALPLAIMYTFCILIAPLNQSYFEGIWNMFMAIIYKITCHFAMDICMNTRHKCTQTTVTHLNTITRILGIRWRRQVRRQHRTQGGKSMPFYIRDYHFLRVHTWSVPLALCFGSAHTWDVRWIVRPQ